MERKCSACGARIRDGMKICANCGKIVPPTRTNPSANRAPQIQPINRKSINTPAQARNRQRANTMTFEPERKNSAPKQRQVSNSGQRQQNYYNNQQFTYPRQQVNYQNQQHVNQNNLLNKPEKKECKSLKPTIIKAIKIAVVVLIVYAVVFAIQVFRVRSATYKFDTDMKLSAEDFGDAIDNSFDSGSWRYNPFTLTVTYKGEKKGEEDYELRFSAFTKIKLKSVSVGGNEKTGDIMESAVLGLFMNDPTEHDN